MRSFGIGIGFGSASAPASACAARAASACVGMGTRMGMDVTLGASASLGASARPSRALLAPVTRGASVGTETSPAGAGTGGGFRARPWERARALSSLALALRPSTSTPSPTSTSTPSPTPTSTCSSPSPTSNLPAAHLLRPRRDWSSAAAPEDRGRDGSSRPGPPSGIPASAGAGPPGPGRERAPPPPIPRRKFQPGERDTSQDKELFGTTSAFAETAPGVTSVDALLRGGFRVNGRKLMGPMIVTPDAVFSWSVAGASVADLRAEHFEAFAVLAPPIELVLVGTGRRTTRNFVLERTLREIVRVDFLDTSNAAATFNMLASEGRRVAAALFPLESW